MKSTKDIAILIVLVALLFLGLTVIARGMIVLGITSITISVLSRTYYLIHKREKYYDYR